MPKLKYNLDEMAVTVPEGRYRARLVKIEQTLSRSAKQPMLVWTWKITAKGPAKDAELRSYTMLVEGLLGNLKEHLEALKFKGDVDVDTASLIGKYAIIVVVSTDQEGRGGVMRTFANIAAVLPDPKKTRKVQEEEYEEDEDEDYEDEEEDYEEDEEDEEDYEEEEEDEDYDDEDYEDEEEEEEEPEPEPAPRRRKAKKSKKLGKSKTKKRRPLD